MPTDQNASPGRRQHFHRGRRGFDRRGGERRPQTQTHEPPNPDQLNVDQIMREIRQRISQRHGIDLTPQQIQELAARRLEAILDPRTIKPGLLEQLRKGAGDPPEPSKEAPHSYTFEDSTLYESHNGFLRGLRRLLNPVLKLFFNPNPLIHALHTQAALNAELARREDERDRRQAEWNALHYALLQRLVLELSRTAVDTQNLGTRVEALGARVDYADRRVRGLEGGPAATGGAASRQPSEPSWSGATIQPASPRTASGDTAEGSSEGARRRRRRRRGRRSGMPLEGGAPGASPGTDLADADGGDDGDFDGGSPDNGPEAAASEDSGERGAEPGEPSAAPVTEDPPAPQPAAIEDPPAPPGVDPVDR